MKLRFIALAGTLVFVLIRFPLNVATSPSQRPASTSAEAAILSQGWTALAGGDLVSAAAYASQAVAEYPRSSAGMSLAVEVDLTRGGPLAGLTTYESWLGSKKVDEAYVLRRLAAAYLRTTSQQRQDSGARIEALKALIAEGEPAAEAELTQRALAGSFAETYALALLGDKRAVQMLISQLRSPGGNKLAIISALVASRSQTAVPPLLEMLTDVREDHRAAAADALGRLGARESTDRIRPLLDDPNVTVRNAAAGALFRLEDYTGLQLLQRLLESEHAGVRLSAVDAMSSQPDARWLGVTRELTRDGDPAVRLKAARLIAPYDNELAAATLGRLQRDDNLAIREEAGRVLSQSVAGDFATLRRLLRSADSLTAVRAADRILELTR